MPRRRRRSAPSGAAHRGGAGAAADKWKAVSLFSNCGAGDIGYASAGFTFEVMAELDPRRLEIALLNHPDATGIAGDLRTTWRKVVRTYRQRAGDVPLTLLAACPPCQGLSSAQSERGAAEDPDAGSRDSRNLLVVVIAKVALALNPRVIVVENVEAFLTRQVRHPTTGASTSAASLLIEMLKTKYAVFPLLANLADFGVPQNRKRAFLTFIARGEPQLAQLDSEYRAPYPRPTHSPSEGDQRHVTLAQALAELGGPKLDSKSKETAGTGLYAVPIWLDRRHAMVAAIPPGSGKSAWENEECEKCGRVRVDADSLKCPKCGATLLRPIVKTRRGGVRFVKGFRSTSYRRMHPAELAPTITTASGHIGSDTTIHPTENRVLSPAECAHLQTFPKNFRWGTALKQWGTTNVRAMIGEAVPPLFTAAHGRALMGVLTGRWLLAAISQSDVRFQRASVKLGLNRLPASSQAPVRQGSNGVKASRTSGALCPKRVQPGGEPSRPM